MKESLIPCRVCNHQVAESAIRCPGCGAKLGEEINRNGPEWRNWSITDNFFMRFALGFLVAFFLYLAIVRLI